MILLPALHLHLVISNLKSIPSCQYRFFCINFLLLALSDDSEDDDAEKKNEDSSKKADQNQVQVSSAPVKTFHPPQRSIPFKSAGNSAPKPPQQPAVPHKKPMGKPLTMIKERLGKVSVVILVLQELHLSKFSSSSI